MWIHKSTARLDLANKDKLTEQLSTEELLDTFRAQKGFHAYYLVENLDDPNQMASITLWETREDGKTFYASPEYREILTGAIPLIEGKPVMETFNVRTELEVLIPA